jgi:hypothetical protein
VPRRIPVPLGTQTYQSVHRPVSAQRLVNMHAELSPPETKSPISLHRNEGIELVAELHGPGRGAIGIGSSVYAVAGNTLWLSQIGGTLSPLGTIPGSGPVDLETNGAQLGILLDDGAALIHDVGTDVITQITDPDFPGAAWWEFFDQYFVFGFKDGSGFGLSALANGLAYDPLDIATPESSPDGLIAGVRDHRSLYLFGPDSVEEWYDSGASDFPFERKGDGVYEVGCAARRSPAVVNNATHFLAVEKGGLSVRRLASGVPTRISTPALDAWLDTVARTRGVFDAYGLTWTMAGHAYYGLTFPSAGRTMVFDAATEKWAERKSFSASIWRPAATVQRLNGGVAVLDSITGQLGRMSGDVHTEFGEPIAWETVSAPMGFQGRQLTFQRFELEINAGQGLAEGQGMDPTLWLSWSDDDGRTWSNAHAKSMGRQGAYATRLVWTQLGTFKGASRGRIFRLHGADPVLTGIVQAFVDVEVGA